MKGFKLKYKTYGDRSVLIEWPSEIDENILKDVLLFKNKLLKHYIKLKVEVRHAYNSILITYDTAIGNAYDEFEIIKQVYQSQIEIKNIIFTLWKIPVCYDEGFALDLDEICTTKNSSKSEIIRLHSSVIYTVYFVGFLPGFLYLGGLDSFLKFPRKSIPRLHVKKGAVAIGGNQTGVYPISSPGGWNIIGNSPINFFNSEHERPCFAQSGDKIQFYPVDLKTYHDISRLVEAGVYQLESEVIDG